MKKIAINGFGRIGRLAFQNLEQVSAINDLADINTLAHLLKYDSVYGKYSRKVEVKDNFLIVDGKEIKVYCERDPKNIDWQGIDVVLECTGAFTSLEKAKVHLDSGAKRVIISAPAQNVPSYILGVNEKEYKGESIVDMGSCTTNCLAPIVKLLNDNYGIEKGYMSTVHSYTNDQNILDLSHKDLRRARAAGLNMIPTSTGAAKAIGKVIPELEGKLQGIAIRVPTPTVSLLDLTIISEKGTTKEQVNELFERNSNNIITTEKEPLVSSDFIQNSHSAIIDLSLTQVNNNLIKIVAWYDNEWAYALRLAEFCKYIANYDNSN
ncbi:MAG: type I glyceraldehyde-3-phosphate dehydrogenase [Candidatus Pacebacteria bacterium]|nr:type I glyceraldehyde-3-phosphate dehydrogenase [Candidatus Paceibacterota bacterium]